VLRLTTTMIVNPASIGAREARLSGLATKHAGVLDGWAAAPTP
jgi:hypothetical protein